MLASRTWRVRLVTVLGTLAIAPAASAATPVATTGVAVVTSAQSAELSGSVSPTGAPTSYSFEYGPTTFYGSTTPSATVGPEMTTVAAAATVAGLRPGWPYHYRLVATNADGVAKGFDRTFTTWTLIPRLPSTPPPAPARPFAGVRLVSSRLTVASGSIAVRLSCPVRTVGRCSGRTELTSRTSSAVLLGRAPFSVGAGQRATVRVRVAGEGRRLLRRVGELSGTDTNAARDGDGAAETTVARVTIRRRHR